MDLITIQYLGKFKLELLEDLKEMVLPEPRKRWIRTKEVRELLSCSASSIQKLKISGAIHGTKIGGN